MAVAERDVTKEFSMDDAYGTSSVSFEIYKEAFKRSISLEGGTRCYGDYMDVGNRHQYYQCSAHQGRIPKTVIAYHAGYNGCALSKDLTQQPNLFNNVFLAKLELIEEGFEPAKDIGFHTMSHLGAGEDRGRVWTMDEMVDCTAECLQAIPKHVNIGFVGSSLGNDMLLKGMLKYEANESMMSGLRGMFGISSAINGFDAEKFDELYGQMTRIQKAVYYVGGDVSVAGYRITKAAGESAVKNDLVGEVLKDRELDLRFIHSRHDGVMPIKRTEDTLRTVFGDRAKLHIIEDQPSLEITKIPGLDAHMVRGPVELKLLREQIKDWMKGICQP